MELKITAFSDTHTFHKKTHLPICDISIFAGDLSSVGYKHEIKDFLKWYSNQTGPTFKIFIAGNHDISFENDKEMVKELLNEYPDLIYLENSSTEVYGIKIWGSPFSPTFGKGWAFNANRGDEIQKIWDLIPEDTNIVVTHTPVFGKLDYSRYKNENAGCENLRNTIKKIKPKIHVCGHIHECGGSLVEDEHTTYINASLMDFYFKPRNHPITVNYNI